MPDDIKFQVGQAVPWPAAPMGIAQVEELRRTTVRLCYPCKTGRVRHPIVRADKLARLGRLLLKLDNPFSRGVIQREKIFKLPPPPPLSDGGVDE
ncbi:MAG: hypothetical protein WBD40_08815 [Tepidisphaeraceae bacterium]